MEMDMDMEMKMGMMENENEILNAKKYHTKSQNIYERAGLTEQTTLCR